MISEGQIVLFRFPQTDQTTEKLRPALVLRRLPGLYNDWLICMISSNLDQNVPDFDEVIIPNDIDFKDSGLKVPSLIRIGRLAVVKGLSWGQIFILDNARWITMARESVASGLDVRCKESQPKSRIKI
jgi:mRNA interferase MazF